MGQYSCQMWEESFVNGEETFGLDRLCKTVKYTLIKVAVLIVHARHYGVYFWSATEM